MNVYTLLQCPELLQLAKVYQLPFSGRHLFLSYDAEASTLNPKH